jgi:hypothetical protein
MQTAFFYYFGGKVSRALVIYPFEPGSSNLTAMNHISDIIAEQPVLTTKI